MPSDSATTEAHTDAQRTRTRRWRVKLRITITVGVVFITVAVAASLVSLNYWTSSASVHGFTQALLEPIAGLVAARAQNYLDSGRGAALVAADVAGQAPSALDRLDAVETIAVSLLRERPELYYLQYGDPEGSFEIVQRATTGDGRLEATRIRRDSRSVATETSHLDPGANIAQIRERTTVPPDGYDPRERPWYKSGIGSSDLQWTDAYVHGQNHLVITAARSVWSRDGRLLGVASAAVSLEALSAFLDTIRLRDRPAHVFLVDSKGTLLASSTFDHVRADSLQLPKLSEVGIPELASLATTGQLERALQGGSAPVAMSYASKDVRYLGVLRPLSLQGGRDWIVGAVVPEDDFLGEVKADSTRSVVISALVIGLFVILAAALSSSIAKPLGLIADETRRIQKLELDDRPLPDSIFEEVVELNDVLTGLKTGLRAFEKYVPVKLVRLLLAEGIEPTLGGRVEELTLLFTDIREFTAFAEAHDPAELARVLGEYLKTIAETVNAYGGTVDKFIGDAVMSFWNAPRPVDDHAHQAVLAAARCRDRIREIDPSGALFTRFGIHTARVAVGNFGAPERFAYTALGDGVNLAARLEGANKEYGTEILISEETHARLAGRFVCRRIDRIAVKGRTLPTAIYEVLGERGAVPERLQKATELYEAGLDAYLGRDFGRASDLFGRAEVERPDDLAAKVMRARARRYGREPPPTEWRGVYAMQAK